jgi:tRNA pseudouridine38-40 synthase
MATGSSATSPASGSAEIEVLVPRFKLTLEYAGTRYSGWQVQKNARTVAGAIEEALRPIAGGAPFDLYGSGRTDAGVHALRQIAHLDLVTNLEPQALCFALNDRLPPDVNILAVERVPHRFHARHGAVGRSYLYQISRRRTAFAKPFVWWVKDDLDVTRMRAAAGLLVGMRDFRSFTDDEPEEKTTRVLVEGIEIAEEGVLILIRIRGSHFLWKMVRRMVGVLAEVGRGQLSTEDVARFLREPSEAPARLTAPPSGLFLERVLYEGEGFDAPLRGVLNPSARAEQPASAPTTSPAHRPSGRGAAPRPVRGRRY